MREVAVHLEDQIGTVGEGAAEDGDVRRAEPLLRPAVQDGDEGEVLREPVGDLAGAVGRVVVDDEDVDAERLEGAQHRLDVGALVIGREADRRLRHGV